MVNATSGAVRYIPNRGRRPATCLAAVRNQMALNQNGNDQSARVADAVKAQVNQTAAAAREGISKVADFRDQATEHSQQTLRTGIETASHQVRETADRFTRTSKVSTS